MTEHGAKHARLVLLILFVALLLRMAAAVAWQQQISPERFLFGDSDSYWVLARTIAHGEPYQYGGPTAAVFRTPGYPLLLAGWFTLLGDEPSVLAARMLGVLLGTLSVGLVYLLGRQLFGRTTGFVAASLATIYPGAIVSSVLILSEPAFCPLMLLQIILLINVHRTGGRHLLMSTFLVGFVGGCATLVRPSWLLFTPAVALLLLFVTRGVTRKIAVVAALLLAMCVPLAPWWVRNARRIGHFVPTTLQVGASLYDGLNPRADGSSNMGFVSKFRTEECLSNAGPTDDVFEYRIDRRMRQAALDWAEGHPGRVLQLAGIKFLRLWNVWPNAAEFGSWFARTLVAISYGPLMILGLLGVWRFRHRGFGWLLCWGPAAYFTALHMVFVGSLRYREPAMLTWIVLSAAVLVSWTHVDGLRPTFNPKQLHKD